MGSSAGKRASKLPVTLGRTMHLYPRTRMRVCLVGGSLRPADLYRLGRQTPCTILFPSFKAHLTRARKSGAHSMSSTTAAAFQSHRQVWAPSQPVRQSFYEYVAGSWERLNPYSITGKVDAGNYVELDRFTVLSWNVDFMRPLEDARMKTALSHIYTHVQGRGEPIIVMLNEMLDTDIELMKATDWIQRDYRMTDISNINWDKSEYGTCMLVPKKLEIEHVFRVHYEVTQMGRDALFVDCKLPRDKTLRIGTTHLESLRADPPKRPAQLAEAAKFMHEADASVLGGDLNAIEPFDKTLHSDNKLRDAYLENGGQEGDESGMTWGHMVSDFQRSRYGLGRLDKLLFCGGLEVVSFETFGLDVEVEDEAHRQRLMSRCGLAKGWVTDHLGVKAEFRVAVQPAG